MQTVNAKNVALPILLVQLLHFASYSEDKPSVPESYLKQFRSISKRSIDEHFSSSKSDADLYDNLKIAEQIKNKKPIAKGNFGEVYKVTIDGKEYIAKKEEYKPFRESKEAFKQRVYKERINALIQNEFARAHPEANFVRTFLSCLTHAGDFVTIGEFRGGGNLLEKFNGYTEPSAGNGSGFETLVNQLYKQLEIYQTGIKVSIAGKEYVLSFFHGDIKPENAILDADHKTASFIDFGTSRIILVLSRRTLELKTHSDGTTSRIAALNINTNPKSDDNIVNGTSKFQSPEIIFYAKNHEFTERSTEADQILKNIDTYAMNMLTFIIARDGDFPLFLGDLTYTTQSDIEDATVRGVEAKKVTIGKRPLLKFTDLAPPKTPEEANQIINKNRLQGIMP